MRRWRAVAALLMALAACGTTKPGEGGSGPDQSAADARRSCAGWTALQSYVQQPGADPLQTLQMLTDMASSATKAAGEDQRWFPLSVAASDLLNDFRGNRPTNTAHFASMTSECAVAGS